jgi:hypothetical protein
MDERQIAWAAGIFEGEGTVYAQAPRAYPHLRVVMTDQDIIERLCQVTGTGNVRSWGLIGGKNKPLWHWTVNGIKPVFRVLKMFWPYLGERRRAQAAKAIAEYYLSPVKRIPSRRNSNAVSV